VRPVHDGHGAATDHLHRPVWIDDRAGVLVETEADERGRLRDRGEQPTEPRPLLEVLIDNRVGYQSKASGKLNDAMTWRGAGIAESEHVRREGARARGGTSDHGAPIVREVQSRAQAGARDDRSQSELVPSREEHTGCGREGSGDGGILRFRSLPWVQPGDLPNAQIAEDLLVDLIGPRAEL
jgi:hypothetical protein